MKKCESCKVVYREDVSYCPLCEYDMFLSSDFKRGDCPEVDLDSLKDAIRVVKHEPFFGRKDMADLAVFIVTNNLSFRYKADHDEYLEFLFKEKMDKSNFIKSNPYIEELRRKRRRFRARSLSHYPLLRFLTDCSRSQLDG